MTINIFDGTEIGRGDLLFDADANQTILMLFGGIVASLFLFALALSFLKTTRRAQTRADRMTLSLRENEAKLRS